MPDSPDTGIDPDDLATTLRVLGALNQLDEEHPDFVTVRRATSRMFKAVKQTRRREIRAAISDADNAVVAATPAVVFKTSRREMELLFGSVTVEISKKFWGGRDRRRRLYCQRGVLPPVTCCAANPRRTPLSGRQVSLRF